MTNALLPPDPTRDGHYYLDRNAYGSEIWEWQTKTDDRFFGRPCWVQNHCARSAESLASDGWRMTSPHPIPTAAQLDALYALGEKWKDKALREGNAYWVMAARECIDDLCAALKGDAP